MSIYERVGLAVGRKLFLSGYPKQVMNCCSQFSPTTSLVHPRNEIHRDLTNMGVLQRYLVRPAPGRRHNVVNYVNVNTLLASDGA